MIGVVGWVVVLGLVVTWEGLAIALKRPEIPTTSDMLRAVSRPHLGRWLLFAAWLWLGWHLFIRGWTFFLAGPGARSPGRGAAKTAGQVLRGVVLPVLIFYAGAVALVVGGWRERIRSAGGSAAPAPDVPARTHLGQIALTVAGGYAAFVAVIGVYALAVPHAGDLLSSAARGGGFLAFAVALPVFMVAGIAQSAWRARRSRPGPGAA